MAKLEIRVGASVDRNLQIAYRPLVEAAKRAAAAIDAEGKKGGRSISRETKKGVDEAEKKFRELEREVTSGMPRAMNVGVKAVVDFSKETKRNFDAVKRNFQDMAREAEKQLANVERASKRSLGEKFYAAAGGSKGVLGPSNLSRAGMQAAGIARAGARMALGIVGSLARGAGVQTDVGTIFRKNSELETIASQLSASGYMPGTTGRNARRVDPRELMRESLDIGQATGTDANDVIEGLQKFVGLTGDLATGRDVLKDMLVLSKATGTEFADMAAAAGNVAANLPDTADKGQRVKDVMRAIAGQGKVGAVEIKDLATHMARLAAQSAQFEGDQGQTIETLGVMAQMSRATGGSPSAREATGSISSFVGMLKTKKRAEEFRAATGVDVFNQKTGMLRDPMTIIKEALRAKGMDPIAFKTIFQNMQGGRAVEGWATIFRKAGGGDAGIAAVEEEFKRLRDSSMSVAEVQESFRRSMQTGNSQAEQFNQAMRKSALQMQEALLPAVQQLAPVIVDATTKLVGFTTAMFGNQVEQNLKQSQEKGRSVLESAATQVRGGKISVATEKDMEASERDLKAAMFLAQSDANDAEKGKMGGAKRAALKAFDYTPAGIALALLGGSEAGYGVGHAAVDKDDVETQKKAFEADTAKKAYEEMRDANKELHRKIDQGIVVVVKNIDELKGAPGAPGIDPSGTMPSPEEKAKER